MTVFAPNFSVGRPQIFLKDDHIFPAKTVKRVDPETKYFCAEKREAA
jgi:hypothetical protein